MSLLLIMLSLLSQDSLRPTTPENSVLVLKQSHKKNTETPHQQYLQLLEGFEEGVSQLPRNWNVDVVDIYDENFLATAKPENYRLVVCLGTLPAKLALSKYAQIPMIYSMVLNPSRYELENLSPTKTRGIQGGILARIAPKDYLNNIVRVHPDARTIGMLYSNEVFADYADDIVHEGKKRGILVTCKVVKSNRELIPKFNELLDQKVDLFLMLPDTEIFSKAYEFIFMETMRRNIPVMGPSSNYVKAGALWGVVLSPYDIGLQTAQMMRKALLGKPLSIEYPLRNKLTFNYIVAKKLSINFPDTLVESSKSAGRLVE